jgi:multimeric flavodoxin WrbA
MSNQRQREPQILCIYGSPRAEGNTDLLLDAFIDGAQLCGAKVRRVYLRELEISPCLAIEACALDGKCALEDDMTPLYEELRTTDAVVFATPIMFYGPSAFAKAFIDRCQALWNTKYTLKREVATGRLTERRAVLISVGATRGEKLFDPLKMIFRYFLDTFSASLWGEVLVRGVDHKGEILKSPDALKEAHALGEELATTLKDDLAKVLADV